MLDSAISSDSKGDILEHVDPSLPGAAPLYAFADKFEDAIKRKDVNSMRGLVHNTADAFVKAIETTPREFLRNSLNVNLKCLEDSKLPDDLKQTAKRYLESFNSDQMVHFDYDVGNATQSILRHKKAIDAVSLKENYDFTKIMQQARHLLSGLYKILTTVADHLQEMVDTTTHKFTLITMDTITYHYDHWQKLPSNDTVWIDPHSYQRPYQHPFYERSYYQRPYYQPNNQFAYSYPSMPPMSPYPPVLTYPPIGLYSQVSPYPPPAGPYDNGYGGYGSYAPSEPDTPHIPSVSNVPQIPLFSDMPPIPHAPDSESNESVDSNTNPQSTS